MFDVAIVILLVYYIDKIIIKINSKKIKYSFYIGVLLYYFIITYLFYRLYSDYSEFSKIREKTMIEQIDNNNTFIFYTYDGKCNSKFIYNFRKRALDILIGLDSEENLVNQKYNFYGEYTIEWNEQLINIR